MGLKVRNSIDTRFSYIIESLYMICNRDISDIFWKKGLVFCVVFQLLHQVSIHISWQLLLAYPLRISLTGVTH